MVDYINMGGFFAMRRKAKGFTQEEVAEIVNICEKTVRNLESGATKNDYDILIRICDLYGILLTELEAFYSRDSEMAYALELYTKRVHF